jgi:hypothetical protein
LAARGLSCALHEQDTALMLHYRANAHQRCFWKFTLHTSLK